MYVGRNFFNTVCSALTSLVLVASSFYDIFNLALPLHKSVIF
jgi:hypothetical protein